MQLQPFIVWVLDWPHAPVPSPDPEQRNARDAEEAARHYVTANIDMNTLRPDRAPRTAQYVIAVAPRQGGECVRVVVQLETSACATTL